MLDAGRRLPERGHGGLEVGGEVDPRPLRAALRQRVDAAVEVEIDVVARTVAREDAGRGAPRIVESILQTLAPHPGETPDAMFFRYWGDNPFRETLFDHLSTFAVDVDTASYSLVRNYLSRAVLPPKAAVRTEEFVNSFGVEDGTLEALNTEIRGNLERELKQARVSVLKNNLVDALLATVQMPGGIPVATFAIGKAGAKNAGLFAAAILAFSAASFNL